MNRRQRITAQVGGVLLLFALLIPPFNTQIRIFRVGEDTLFSGPVRWSPLWKDIYWTSEAPSSGKGVGIAWGHLGIELAIIAVITGLVFVSVKDKE